MYYRPWPAKRTPTQNPRVDRGRNNALIVWLGALQWDHYIEACNDARWPDFQRIEYVRNGHVVWQLYRPIQTVPGTIIHWLRRNRTLIGD
jgi:hypothetical protein